MRSERLLLVFLISCLSFLSLALTRSPYDLTIVGPLKFADGLPGVATGFISCLHSSLKINVIPTSVNFSDMPLEIQRVVSNPDKVAGNVTVFTDLLWTDCYSSLHLVPESMIKIAYSMCEATTIPSKWVEILNGRFDAVVVPDNFLVEVYKSSGVTLPIFVLPCCLFLEDLLDQPLKVQPSKPFVFGVSAGLGQDKNHELLLKAFIKEFGNSKKVCLRIHGRSVGNNTIRSNLLRLIKKHGLTNVTLDTNVLSRSDYVRFLTSLDCYVLISRGEGFSITPREAFALGLPCILSNNTAHKTICSTGLSYPIESCTLVKPDYTSFGNFLGYKFNCKITDVRKALKALYQNYAFYIQRAAHRRSWVMQYLASNLRNKYYSLIKPRQVVLSTENKIEDNCLLTNSESLYKKYVSLITSN